jgi:hypothetical protein
MDGIEILFDPDNPYFAAWIGLYDMDGGGGLWRVFRTLVTANAHQTPCTILCFAASMTWSSTSPSNIRRMSMLFMADIGFRYLQR